jgi:hypothetical protein
MTATKNKHETLEETTNSKPSSDESVKKVKSAAASDGKASIAGSVFNLANAVCSLYPL